MKEQIIDCNNGCKMLFYSGAEFADYSAAVLDAKARGMRCYDTFTVRDNYHSVYVNADHVEIIYYVGHVKELRVINDPNTELFEREPVGQIYTVEDMQAFEPGGTGMCSDKAQHDRDGSAGAGPSADLGYTLYQFETDYSRIDCGMFYAVRCPDGSFFLIDSGHQDSVNDHIRIHDFLKKHTPSGSRIKIRGWFLTHAHQDHIVKFMDFLRSGFDDYELDTVYYNFPSPDSDTEKYWKDSDKATMREFEAYMEEHSEIRRVKLHTGEHFFVNGLEFIVLCTFEDVYPDRLKNFNDSSTVLLMRASGTTVFWAGDAGEAESDIIHARYGAFVKSDILQAAHHGFRGGTTGLYGLIAADTVLFSTSARYLAFNDDRATTIRAKELAKEWFIAGEGTVAMKLPYHVGEAIVWPKEIPGL